MRRARLAVLLAAVLAIVGAASAHAATVTYHLRANVDGRSDLILTGDTVHWHHFDWAAPGTWDDSPTQIDGTDWLPTWPQPGENRFCNCDSSTFTGLAPPVPAGIQHVTLARVGDGCRSSCSVSVDGDTVVVHFDDDPFGGPAWYEVDVTVAADGLVLGDLPPGTVGTPYDEAIGVTGGAGPYTFSLASGALPAGLSISADGRITGTPTTGGNATFTVGAEDSSSPAKTGSRSYSVHVAGPAVELDPGALSFGPVLVGRRTTKGGLARVRNSGDAPLTVSSLALAGSNPGQFSLGEDACTGTTIDAGASCAFRVHFAPTSGGVQNARVEVADNAGDSSQRLAVSGTGAVEPRVAVRRSVAFADQAVGTPGPRALVAVRNAGNQTLHVSSLDLGGADPGQFRITDKTCLGAAVAPGARCTFKVHFVPTVAGPHTASVLIGDDAPGSPQIIALSARATQPAASVRQAVAFGERLVGRTTSNGGLVTVRNTGDAALHVSGLGLAGSDPGQFAITDSTCGAAVAVGEHCSFKVRFAPTSAGAKTARVQIADDAADTPQTVALTGTGVAEPRVVVRSSIEFPDTAVGALSPRRYIVVRNAGSRPLTISSLALAGAEPGQFALRDKSCLGGPIAPGARCTIKARFAPTSVGPHAASAVIDDDAPGAPQTIALSGAGT